MNWQRPIDAYCERLGPGFWAEPWNAMTNGAFLLAALWIAVVAWRQGRLDLPVVGLTALVLAIGIGSFLFHTFAVAWAAVADVVPILLFILGYFATALARFGRLGWGSAGLGVLGYLAATAALTPLVQSLGLGGGGSYLTALLALIGVGVWLARRQHPAASGLLTAAAIFGVSLTFRTLDHPVCGLWPVGTHFLWHLLNAVVLGLLLLLMVRHGAAEPAAPSSCGDPAATV